jgi:hypothetical protein
MRIRIVSSVDKDFLEVFEGFSAELFEHLAPKGQLKLLRFDGCKTGDLIEIQFLKPIKTLWVSEVTEHHISDEKAYFIDQAAKPPYGLTKWKHQHIVKKTGQKTCEIIDEIDYKGANWLITCIHFLPLYFSFYQRKVKYVSFFMKK